MRSDPLAGAEAVNPLADSRHDARRLVPQYARQRATEWVLPDVVEVRGADCGRQSLHEHLARPGLRYRHSGQFDATGVVEHQRLHRFGESHGPPPRPGDSKPSRPSESR